MTEPTYRMDRPVEILLVEDNAGDVRLTREALDESQLSYRLSVVDNGVNALLFLRHQGQYANAPLPDLILLDLNLPKKDGREVLAEIKSDQQLKRIPVVVLTTSIAEDDIQRSYDLHTNCYITKPLDLDEFIRVVQTIKDFWFTIVQLPTQKSL